MRCDRKHERERERMVDEEELEEKQTKGLATVETMRAGEKERETLI